MAIEQLVGHFGAVVDPHCQDRVEHHLTDILVLRFRALGSLAVALEKAPEADVRPRQA